MKLINFAIFTSVFLSTLLSAECIDLKRSTGFSNESFLVIHLDSIKISNILDSSSVLGFRFSAVRNTSNLFEKTISDGEHIISLHRSSAMGLEEVMNNWSNTKTVVSMRDLNSVERLDIGDTSEIQVQFGQRLLGSTDNKSINSTSSNLVKHMIEGDTYFPKTNIISNQDLRKSAEINLEQLKTSKDKNPVFLPVLANEDGKVSEFTHVTRYKHPGDYDSFAFKLSMQIVCPSK
jgi:hypothetical protein